MVKRFLVIATNIIKNRYIQGNFNENIILQLVCRFCENVLHRNFIKFKHFRKANFKNCCY